MVEFKYFLLNNYNYESNDDEGCMHWCRWDMVSFDVPIDEALQVIHGRLQKDGMLEDRILCPLTGLQNSLRCARSPPTSATTELQAEGRHSNGFSCICGHGQQVY